DGRQRAGPGGQLAGHVAELPELSHVEDESVGGGRGHGSPLVLIAVLADANHEHVESFIPGLLSFPGCGALLSGASVSDHHHHLNVSHLSELGVLPDVSDREVGIGHAGPVRKVQLAHAAQKLRLTARSRQTKSWALVV
ncbi:hypothetical protein EGW08_023551, partial [Elysia chlorotica]